MATKKALPKTAAKTAKPAKKAPAPKKAEKPAAKKAASKASPKTAPKKAAPAKNITVKAAPKTAVKAAAPKKTSVGINKKAAEPAKKALPAKTATAPVKAPTAKPAPAKQVEPVKKHTVEAPTKKEVKPAIQPIKKPDAKKEPPKPVKVVIPKTTTTKVVKYEPDFTKSVLDSNNQENPGPTMRYSDAELTEFRELINKKLDTAKKELAYLQGLITRKDEGGDLDEGRYMTMEDGSMSMEREQLSQMASRQIQFIDHLEKAIMRIENKTYGICRVTGKLIDKARLRAVPHATLSIEAKQMMNK
jgi:RNA polymerase-binding transcription factor DksA